MNRQRFEKYSTYATFGGAFIGLLAGSVAGGYATDALEMPQYVQYLSSLAGAAAGGTGALFGGHYFFKGLERIIFRSRKKENKEKE
ncbi:MAG: hypothetical protein MUF61_03175 [archaeon]|jgi:hypothetical protein|nr:hypothetical protein [archaeon]